MFHTTKQCDSSKSIEQHQEKHTSDNEERLQHRDYNRLHQHFKGSLKSVLRK